MQFLRQFFLISAFFSLATYTFGQSKKEFAKHLTIFTSEKFDKRYQIVFEKKNPDKHGFDKLEDGFTETFKKNGFSVIPINSSAEKKGKYKIVIDYDYGYLIYAYKMQYSNLKADVVDMETSEVVGTITFNDRFNIKETGDKISEVLQSKPLPKIETPSATKVPKTKEERLRELKDLFEKNLITQQEYDAQKKRILEEQ